MLGLEDRKRTGRWATALSSSCVAVLKLLCGTMVRLVRVGVPVVVATRGVFPTVLRRRRARVLAANAIRTTVRQHATFPTAVGFTIAAQLAYLGVDTATSADKGFGTVPKRVIRTVTVATATLVVPKDLTSFFRVG